MTRLLAFLLLVLLAATGHAQIDKMDSQYVITASGTLEIDPAGKVHAFELSTRLDPQIADAIQRRVDGWRFQPILVDGRPVIASTQVHLTLEARADDNQVGLWINDVIFGSLMQGTDDARRRTIRYPVPALRAGLGARVMLAVRADAAGKVLEIHPYQTSLSRELSDRQASRYRQAFEKAATRAIREWEFESAESIDGVPAGGSFMVPIEFQLLSSPVASLDGTWRAYVPGPISEPAWADVEQSTEQLAALAANESLPLNSRFRLVEDVRGSRL